MTKLFLRKCTSIFFKVTFFLRNYFTFIILWIFRFFLHFNLKRKSKFSILVIRLDKTIGDSVMNSSFIRELRVHYKNASISLCVNKSVRALYESCPYIDKLIYFKNDRSGFLNLLFREYFLIRFYLKNLKKSHYDLVIIPRLDYDHYAIPLAYLTQASRRLGYSEKSTPKKSIINIGFNHLLTDVVKSTCIRHEVESNLFLLEHLGGKIKFNDLEVWIRPKFKSYVKSILNIPYDHSNNKLIFTLGLSSGHSKLKEWPLENYVKLTKLIRERWTNKNIYFLLLGSNLDIPSALIFKKIVPSSSNIIDMVGKTSIQESAALIKGTDYFIGNDSGLLHIAAASGIPVIGIFGSSCYHRFGPWGKRAKSVSINLDCCPCNQNHQIDRCSSCIYKENLCMKKVTPQHVFNELISI